MSFFLIRRQENGLEPIEPRRAKKRQGGRNYDPVDGKCYANTDLYSKVRDAEGKVIGTVKRPKGREVPCGRHLQAKYACRGEDGKFLKDSVCASGKVKRRELERYDVAPWKEFQLKLAAKKGTGPRLPKPARRRVVTPSMPTPPPSRRTGSPPAITFAASSSALAPPRRGVTGDIRFLPEELRAQEQRQQRMESSREAREQEDAPRSRRDQPGTRRAR